MVIFNKQSLEYALNSDLPHAFWLVGRALANGIGEHRDIAAAKLVFDEGAQRGSPLCRRDLALLELDNQESKKERSKWLSILARSAATGAGHFESLNLLILSGSSDHRATAIRWLQRFLVFHADWRAGFALYLALLFRDGKVPKDKDFLHEALFELVDENAIARKALAFGLLSGALTGRSQWNQALKLLGRGKTPNEMALTALVRLEHSGNRSTRGFLMAERQLFFATQAGSTIGNALLLRLTLQQAENTSEPLSREHICRALIEHLASFPMHADETSLSVIVRWFAEDQRLRENLEPRLRKALMRSSELGLTSALVALARLTLIAGHASGAVDRLRMAALRGNTTAVELLALPVMRSSGALNDTEGRFWEHLSGLRQHQLHSRASRSSLQPEDKEILHAVS